MFSSTDIHYDPTENCRTSGDYGEGDTVVHELPQFSPRHLGEEDTNTISDSNTHNKPLQLILQNAIQGNEEDMRTKMEARNGTFYSNDTNIKRKNDDSNEVIYDSGSVSYTPSILAGLRSSQRETDLGNNQKDASPMEQNIVLRWNKILEDEEDLRKRTLIVDRVEKQTGLFHKDNTAPLNFPPIASRYQCFCFRPIIHHDITCDIPIDRQRLVRIFFSNYIFTAFLIIANFIVVLTSVASPTVIKAEGWEDAEYRLEFQIVLAVPSLIGVIIVFPLWYWPAYRANATGNKEFYVLSFIGLGVSFCYAIASAVGPVGYGGAGFLFANEVRAIKGVPLAIVIVVMACLWLLESIICLVLIFFLQMKFKEDIESLNTAKAQFAAISIKYSI
eukprot:Tbor_TRINITY_DN5711_c1_g1::TRINITY_DN5711_c1_g1_i1::g.20874::m.20874/K19995/SCAMP; secretory carrier-associated membrane protein